MCFSKVSFLKLCPPKTKQKKPQKLCCATECSTWIKMCLKWLPWLAVCCLFNWSNKCRSHWQGQSLVSAWGRMSRKNGCLLNAFDGVEGSSFAKSKHLCLAMTAVPLKLNLPSGLLTFTPTCFYQCRNTLDFVFFPGFRSAFTAHFICHWLKVCSWKECPFALKPISFLGSPDGKEASVKNQDFIFYTVWQCHKGTSSFWGWFLLSHLREGGGEQCLLHCGTAFSQGAQKMFQLPPWAGTPTAL